MDAPSVANHSDFGGSELSKSPKILLTMAAVVTVLIMLVGLFGNILTIIALFKCPKVRNVAAAFIISLCIADSLFCATVLPFAVSDFSNGGWIYGDGILCRIVPFLRYGNIGVSLLSITMITVNRYIIMDQHGLSGRIYTKLNIAFMIAFTWLFAYSMQIPTLTGIWGAYALDPVLGTCSIVADKNGHSSKTTLFVFAFLVPAVLIIVCYAKIFWIVHSSEVRMREHRKKQNAGSQPADLNNVVSNAKVSSIKDSRESKAKRNEWRVTKMVLAVFLSFIICYLPLTVIKVTDKNVHYPALHIIGYLLLYASSCVNPIIYVIMNAQYRAAYAQVLFCKNLPAGLSSVVERWRENNGVASYNTRTAVSQVSMGESTVQPTPSGE